MDLLPIGSIVLLKGGIKKVMISGYLVKGTDGLDKDYMGVPYPEGFISFESLFSFNKEDIDKVISNGYENEIFKKFMNKLGKEE